MEKWCPKCNTVKPVAEFAKNASRFDGLQTKCRACDSAFKKSLYSQDPDKYKKRTKEAKKHKTLWFQEFKKTQVCSSCGEKKWYLIDFHHPKAKKENISRLVANNVSIENIMREIKKCIPLCANCHRELHFLKRNVSSTLTVSTCPGIASVF